MPFFPESLVEEKILWNLGLIQFDESVWDDMKRSLFDFEAKEVMDMERRTLRTELEKTENKLDRIYEDRIEGRVSERYYMDRQPKWEKRVEEIREQLEDLDNQLDNWKENVGVMIETVDSLRDFKSKWLELTPKSTDKKAVQADKKEKQRHMLRLITKRIYTSAYTGSLTVVNKRHAKDLNFEWSEEFQILFELGVIKKLNPRTGSLVDKESGRLPTGKTPKTASKKGNLSTNQQKLDFLFAIL